MKVKKTPTVGDERFIVYNGFYWWQLKVKRAVVDEVRAVTTRDGQWTEVEVLVDDVTSRATRDFSSDDFYSNTYATEEEAEAARKKLLRILADQKLKEVQGVLEREGLNG